SIAVTFLLGARGLGFPGYVLQPTETAPCHWHVPKRSPVSQIVTSRSLLSRSDVRPPLNGLCRYSLNDGACSQRAAWCEFSSLFHGRSTCSIPCQSAR